jgi:DNA (cytosine-5)-methyltransferase 1
MRLVDGRIRRLRLPLQHTLVILGVVNSSTKNPTLIDLFAGCGGLSLGLEFAGFEPVFVNELNRDAMESYLLNRGHLAHDLRNARRHCFDIKEVTTTKKRSEELASFLRAEHGEIDLVAGGPPCQGYSGIGHRRTFTDLTKSDIPSNHLYRHMARFIEAVQPRAFVFENVRGLLSARWSPDGDKGEIWRDVQKAFSDIGGRGDKRGYQMGWKLVFAKDYGVPQNRPRVLMVGIRNDIRWSSVSSLAGGFLPEPKGGAPDLKDLLGDLADPDWRKIGETTRYPFGATSEIQRLMRTRLDGTVARKGDLITEMEYSNHSADVVRKFAYMIKNDGEIPEDMKTKKFAQRLLPEVWGPNGPSITATSLPDDYVHFSLPRVPTVREWARLQLFPDRYQFSGKRTTGGRRRAGDPALGDWSRDVPKYTQIGNAVPIGLAQAVGEHVRTLIDR